MVAKIWESSDYKGKFYIAIADNVKAYPKVWLHSDGLLKDAGASDETYNYNSFRWARSVVGKVFHVIKEVPGPKETCRAFEIRAK